MSLEILDVEGLEMIAPVPDDTLSVMVVHIFDAPCAASCFPGEAVSFHDVLQVLDLKTSRLESVSPDAVEGIETIRVGSA